MHDFSSFCQSDTTTIMSNITFSSDLPPLPPYTLTPLPSLLPPIPDKVLTLLLPVAAYWIFSLFFHIIDEYDLFPQYRLHTPAEVSKRNRVSRLDVVRDVVIQQILQTGMGIVLGMTEPDDFIGKESYDVAVWAQRLRWVQRTVPGLFATFGIDSVSMAKNIASSYPAVAGALSGGHYPSLQQTMILGNGEATTPTFAGWEILAAKAIYWFIVPAIQFFIGILVVDTWQYFLHRAMHMNQWLYRKTTLQLSSWLFANRVDRHFSLSPPPSLRTICVRGALQSPSGRLLARHLGYYCSLQAGVHDNSSRHVVLHRLHLQDRGRSLWVCFALGSAAAFDIKQCRLPRCSPSKLGYQGILLLRRASNEA